MANGMNYGPYAGSPMTGIHSPEFFRGMQQRGMEAANAPNWLTDPEAPWNVWAQGLEGYLQDWDRVYLPTCPCELRNQPNKPSVRVYTRARTRLHCLPRI